MKLVVIIFSAMVALPILAKADAAAAEAAERFSICLSNYSSYVGNYCARGLSSGTPPNQVYYQMSVFASDTPIGELARPELVDYYVNFVCGPPNNEGGFYFFAVYGSCAHPKAVSNFKPNQIQELTRDGSQIPKNPFCPKVGSVIEIDNRSVGESIAVSGTGLSLVYQSLYDSARTVNRTIELKTFFDGEFQVPRSIVLRGTKTSPKRFNFAAIGAIDLKFTWDPSESFDQSPFVDSENFNLSVVAPYDSGFSKTQAICPLGTVGGVVQTNCPAGLETYKGDTGILEKNYQIAQYKPQVWGLGGWTLDIHHFYDWSTQQLFYGTGSIRRVQAIEGTVSPYGLVKIVASEDASEVYIFDQVGRHLETRTTLPEFTKFKFYYHANNALDYIVDRDNKITKIHRDASLKPISIIAPYGQVTDIEQNNFGKLTKVTSASGAETIISYNDGVGLLSRISYPSGLVTDFSHTEDGLFLSESKNTGGFQRLSDIFSNLRKNISFSTAENVVTSYVDEDSGISGRLRSEYDVANNLIFRSSYSQDGLTKNFNGEDIQGQTIFQNDPRFGSQSPYAQEHYERTFGQTNVGRRFRTTKEATFKSGNGPLDIETFSVSQIFDQFSLNPITLLTKYSDLNKSVEFFTNGTLISKAVLDSSGRPVRISQPGFLDSVISYNAEGQMTSVANGLRISNYVYGNDGYVSKIFGSNGSLSFDRDREGRITKKILQNGDTIHIAYTPSGSLKEITTPNNEVHRFHNNLLDKVSNYLPPVFLNRDGSTSYTYDLDGRIKTITKPGRGVATVYYKTGTNWIERIQTPEGDYLFQNIDARGRARTATSPDGTSANVEYLDDNIIYEYWNNGNSQYADFGQKRTQINSAGQIIGLEINEQGFSIEYDDFNRVKRVGEENFAYTDLNEIVSRPDGTQYNRATQRISSTFSNTISTNYDLTSTDSEHEMSSRKISASINLSSGTFQIETNENVDARGNVTVSARKFSKAPLSTAEERVSQFYMYDENSRLTQVDEAETRIVNDQNSSIARRNVASYEFGPNSNSNVKSYEHFGKRTVATYGPQDRLIGLKGAIERNFEYSDDGTLSKISNCLGEKRFVYDFFGNLKSVTLPDGKVISYRIDAYNRRVAKFINGQLDEIYVWYDQTRLAFVKSATQATNIQYVYGPHGIAPTYLKINGHGYKVISTWKGDIRFVVDLNGKIVQELQYDEYGNVMKDTSLGRTDIYGIVRNTPLQPMGFASGLTDFDTKMIRFGARDYDPVVGRWTAKDPIGFAGGDTNLYSYVGQNPLNAADPSGLASCTFSKKTGALTCVSNDKSKSYSTSAFSGSIGGDALPSELYIIGRAQNQPSSFFHLSRGAVFDRVYQFGEYSGLGSPVRGGFMIHPGQSSNGCITVDKSDPKRLREYHGIQDLLNLEIDSSTLEVTDD